MPTNVITETIFCTMKIHAIFYIEKKITYKYEQNLQKRSDEKEQLKEKPPVLANRTQSLKQNVHYIFARLLPRDELGFACLNLARCSLFYFVCLFYSLSLLYCLSQGSILLCGSHLL